MNPARKRAYGIAFLVFATLSVGVFFANDGLSMLKALKPEAEPQFVEFDLEADGTLTVDQRTLSDGDLRGFVYDAPGTIYATIRSVNLPPRIDHCDAARTRLINAGFTDVRISVKR